MKLRLVGTGTGRGWPQPHCACASCRSARLHPRRPTQVWIDELIGLGPRPEVIAVPDGWQVSALPAADPDDAAIAVLVHSPGGGVLLHTGVDAPVSRQAVRTAMAAAHHLGARGPRATGVLLSQGGAALDEVATEIARLRRMPEVSGQARFVLVGLGHQNPPERELAALARSWGVTLGSDGDELVVGADDPAASELAQAAGRRSLVIGGTRSGKSRWAERQVAADPVVCYLATAVGRDDPDWAQRIALHQQRRPPHWRTLQTLDLIQALASNPPGQSLLIDDLGNWVAATIDETGGWDDDRMGYRRAAAELVDAWRRFTGRVVLVSSDVGSSVHPSTHAGRVFADEIGSLNAALASESDEVVVVSAGLARWLRTPDGRIEP